MQINNNNGENMKLKTKLLIAAIVVFVISVSIGSFYVTLNTSNEIAPQVMTQVIKPYAELIAKGDYETAYNNYTTKKYRLKTSLEKYIEVQKQNKEYFGKLISMGLASGIFLYERDMDKLWVYRGTVTYNADKLPYKFTVDIIKEDGAFKINQTYPSQMNIRASAPMIF